MLHGHAHRRDVFHGAGNVVARRIGLAEARVRPGEVRIERQPLGGRHEHAEFDAVAFAGAIRFGGAGVADVEQFGIEIQRPGGERELRVRQDGGAHADLPRRWRAPSDSRDRRW